MKIIDFENWERKNHFIFFQSRRNPCLSLTSNVNVKLVNEHRTAKGVRFTDCIYYLIMKSVNKIDEFKTRLVNLVPVQYEIVNAAFTYIPDGHNLHSNCVASYSDNFLEFTKNIQIARDKARINPTLTPDGGDSQGLIYLSCLRDLSFSSLTNPWGDPWLDSVPRIIIGKFDPVSYLMPISVEVLHSFIDGKHLEKFYDMVNCFLSCPEQHLA